MMTEAISGTRRQMRELADGTIRVMIDIDPRFKGDFNRLFPTIDAPVALAPLVKDFERRDVSSESTRSPDMSKKEEKIDISRTGGPIAKWLGARCKDRAFWEWLSVIYRLPVDSAEDAARIVRNICNVQSRADIDGDPNAAALFERHIRGPWNVSQKHRF